MQKNKQSFLILIMIQLCTIFCSDVSYPEFINSSITRLDGIDHKMTVDIITTDNKENEETKQFEMCVHWELDSDNYKMVKIDENVKEEKGLEAWAFHFRKGETKKWVMLPKSGKIKDVSGKKSSDKMDFSEVGLDSNILENEIAYIEDEVLDNDNQEIRCKKFQIISDDETIILWIDSIDFIVHKKEYYNKKQKLFKEVTYRNLVIIDNTKFYKDICIHDHKKKSRVDISLSDFDLSSIDDMNLFSIPK